ncbi:MFS transporter [Streptosporangiaceae bacterium NEAU-GS5]|nr:MFS transporter [Streptosporangiaceae bacterium NEAU-GS5]
MTTAVTRGATFGEVLAVGEFRILFGGFSLQVLGESVKMLALSVLVYTATGSPALAAVAYMIGFVPHALGGTLLLSLADRLPSRPLIVAGEIVRIAVCLALALLGMPVWTMLVIVFLTGMFTPVFMAARNAMLPEVLSGDAYIVGRSMMTVVSASAQVAGLAAGGALLALTGPRGALLLTAALAAAGAVLVRLGLRPRPARHSGGPGSVRETLRGNGELLRDPAIRGLLLAGWGPIWLLSGAEAVIVPYLGAQAGFVLASFAVGMGAGDFVVGRFVPPRLRERLSFPLACLLGVPLMLFAARPSLLAAAALAVLSAACTAFALGIQRRFVEIVPERRRGQAFGLMNAGAMTGQGLGAAALGALAEAVGPHNAVALAGAAILAWSLACRRHLRGS